MLHLRGVHFAQECLNELRPLSSTVLISLDPDLKQVRGGDWPTLRHYGRAFDYAKLMIAAGAGSRSNCWVDADKWKFQKAYPRPMFCWHPIIHVVLILPPFVYLHWIETNLNQSKSADLYLEKKTLDEYHDISYDISIFTNMCVSIYPFTSHQSICQASGLEPNLE